MINNISAIILAGGANTRFNGIIKSNIVINGKTIISGILSVLKNLFSEIIIVTNTPEEFDAHKNHKMVSDQFLKAGPLGGIHAALKAASGEAVFVLAGDMPLLDKDVILKQADHYNSIKCDILIPRINDSIEPLHEIYNTTITNSLEEYLAGKHNYAVREFIKTQNVSYLQLDENEVNKRAFTNINSPSDISASRKNPWSD